MRIINAALAAALVAVFATAPLWLAHADSSFDSALFGDTNSDRASACGQPAFGWSAPMAAIAQQRAQDIATSGDFSNRLEMSYGAENIGWTSENTDTASAAAQINQAYLNSPEHRTNICNGAWSVVGIGSVFVSQWNGKRNVWIDAEEFTGTHSAVRPSAGSPAPAPLSPGVPGTGGAG